MERITSSTWRKHFPPRDLSAAMFVLFLAIAVVTVLIVVLF